MKKTQQKLLNEEWQRHRLKVNTNIPFLRVLFVIVKLRHNRTATSLLCHVILPHTKVKDVKVSIIGEMKEILFVQLEGNGSGYSQFEQPAISATIT